MTCKGICLRHKAIKPIGVGRYAAGQNDVRCAVFLLNGKVFSAHAVDTDFVQSQEIKGTN